MKKILVIFVLVFSLSLSSCGLLPENDLDSTLSFRFIDDNESIVSGSAGNTDLFVITDQGNCYISGSRLIDGYTNGIGNTNDYNKLNGSPFVCIYDKGDAKSVNYNPYGGTIINNDNDVYLFLNNSDSFKVPTYIVSGYQSAVVYHDMIYLLSTDGDLGYIKIDKPEIFQLLSSNIKKFIIENKNDYDYEIFALSEDHRLYITEMNEEIDSDTPYINGVFDFDAISFDTSSVVLSVIDMSHNAYVLMGNIPLDYISFKEILSTKPVGTNISYVTGFGKCIAMVDMGKELSLYGYDFHSKSIEPDFCGEILFDHVDAVIGGNNILFVVTDKKNFYQYGRNPTTGKYVTILDSLK